MRFMSYVITLTPALWLQKSEPDTLKVLSATLGYVG